MVVGEAVKVNAKAPDAPFDQPRKSCRETALTATEAGAKTFTVEPTAPVTVHGTLQLAPATVTNGLTGLVMVSCPTGV